MDQTSSYSCDLCGSNFDHLSKWIKHLTKESHQELARESGYMSFWKDDDVRRSTVTVVCDGEKTYSSYLASKIVKTYSQSLKVLNLAWWDKCVVVQFDKE